MFWGFPKMRFQQESKGCSCSACPLPVLALGGVRRVEKSSRGRKDVLLSVSLEEDALGEGKGFAPAG